MKESNLRTPSAFSRGSMSVGISAIEEDMKRKIISFTFLIIFLSLIGFIFALHFTLPFFLARTISSTMGVPVHIGSVHIRLNKITIRDIDIENPPHSNLKYALRMREIVIDTPLREYIEPKTTIRDILINHIYLSVEFYTKNRKKSNWNTLLQSVNQPLNAPSNEGEPGNQRTIMIDALVLQNIQVELMFAGSRPQMLKPLKRIEIHNIDPENGLLTKRLTRILTNHIIQSISMQSGITGITGIILSAPSAAVETLFYPFKLFERKNKRSKQDKNPSSRK